jgi:hypothetical protein
MADTVATQVLYDNARTAVMKFTNISDGTGENQVTKVDVSTLSANSTGQACTGVTITKIYAMTHGMQVSMYWGADTNKLILTVPSDIMYTMDFREAPLWNNAEAAGKTGDIKFLTRDMSAGDEYSIVLEMTKLYA